MALNILASGIGALGSIFGGRSQSRAIERGQRQQQQFLREGQEAFRQTPVYQTFMPGGEQAFQTRQALLGLGGDPEAARAAFNNYLGSTDFQTMMRTGRDAITGSRAARGLLGSGRTGTALTEFGIDTGRRYLDRYLGNLGQDANMGLNAGQTYANVLTNNASQMAQGAQRAAGAQADITGNMYAGVGGAVGDALQSKPAARLYNRFFGR